MPTFCSLCGEPILDKPETEEDIHTDEHVPPQQFYPKAIRSTLKKPLWTVPSHRKCNGSYKLDEEYFYHHFYMLVGHQNADVGKVIFADLQRRAKKPQTPALIKRILKQCKTVTSGGIILPPGLMRVEYDAIRIHRVVVKIAQCLYRKDYERFLPFKHCEHVELCEGPEELQPIFADLCTNQPQDVDPNIFRYWDIEFEGCHYYTLLFWGAFVFCLAFRSPENES